MGGFLAETTEALWGSDPVGKTWACLAVMRTGLVFVIGGGEFLHVGLHPPDLPGVLGNGAIAGELARSSNVVDHLLGPFLGVLMKEQPLTRKTKTN